MADDSTLSDAQAAWKIRAARILNIPLAADAAAGAAQAETGAEHYSDKTTKRLGPDELGAGNPARAIDLEAFSRHVARLAAEEAEFFADWNHRRQSIEAAHGNIAKEREKLDLANAEERRLIDARAQHQSNRSALTKERKALDAEFEKLRADGTAWLEEAIVLGVPGLHPFGSDISKLDPLVARDTDLKQREDKHKATLDAIQKDIEAAKQAIKAQADL